MSNNRFLLVWKSFVVSAVILMLVILKIVVFNGREYLKAAAIQRVETVKVKNYRGIIYDRNMCPLVDSRTYLDTVKTKKNPIKYSYTKRYDERTLARHLIGYTDAEGNGISGIEKIYNDFLKTDNKYSINVVNDVLKNPIESCGAKILNQSDVKNNLKLTIDYQIQKIAEKKLDSLDFKSSVVVLDVNTFDVLASASRPNFDQNNIQSYINKNGTELIDRSTSQYNAGSIFKIITAAAAIENGIFDDNKMFFCTGSTNVDGIRFNCHKKDGHGFLNFDGAFENSCNCAFYELGIKCGKEKIEEMSQRFGLGKKVLGISYEKCGNVNMEKAVTKADMANISIGQGDILITPVQAAKVAAIIANGGIEKSVNCVDTLVDEDGKQILSFRKNSESTVIKRFTANRIAKMMRDSVLYGTGQNAKSEIVSISGKTGTAQTGWMENGDLMVHGWFIGFFPSQKPEYAMCVFLENGQSGNTASTVFKDIAEEIYKDKKSLY